MKITTIGLDLAKNVLQVHGVDERGKAVVCVGLHSHGRDVPWRATNLRGGYIQSASLLRNVTLTFPFFLES